MIAKSEVVLYWFVSSVVAVFIGLAVVAPHRVDRTMMDILRSRETNLAALPLVGRQNDSRVHRAAPTLGIFCGGYVSNTLLDEVVDAAEKCFHFQTSTYKTDFN